VRAECRGRGEATQFDPARLDLRASWGLGRSGVSQGRASSAPASSSLQHWESPGSPRRWAAHVATR
jgi:hypothetical protein